MARFLFHLLYSSIQLESQCVHLSQAQPQGFRRRSVHWGSSVTIHWLLACGSAFDHSTSDDSGSIFPAGPGSSLYQVLLAPWGGLFYSWQVTVHSFDLGVFSRFCVWRGASSFSHPPRKKNQVCQVSLKTLQHFSVKEISFCLAILGCNLYVCEVFKATSCHLGSSQWTVELEANFRPEIEYWQFLDDWKVCFQWRTEHHALVTLYSNTSKTVWDRTHPPHPPAKCKAMTTDFLDYNSCTWCPICTGRVVIEHVKFLKLLRVYISEDLTWGVHWDYITKKANRSLYALRTLKKCSVPTSDLITVYCSLIQSVIEYASAIFANLPKYVWCVGRNSKVHLLDNSSEFTLQSIDTKWPAVLRRP